MGVLLLAPFFFFLSEKWESSGFLEKWIAVGPFSSSFWVYRVLRRKSNEKVQSFDFSANPCLDIERGNNGDQEDKRLTFSLMKCESD